MKSGFNICACKDSWRHCLLKKNEKKYDRKATKKTQIEKEKEQTRYAVKTWRIKTKDKVTTEAENCGRMST